MIKQDNIIHPLTSFMSFTPIFTISGQHSFFSENWSFHLVSFAFSPKNFLSMFYNASVLATSSFSFLLPDNVSFHFHSWMIFSLATAFWVANWLFCFVFHFKDVSLFETLQFLIRSDTLIGLLSSLHVLRHCSLGLYHRLSTLLTTVCRTWRGILCLLCLVFASPICLFSICFFYCFYFSAETSHFCAKISMHWKHVSCNENIEES